MGLDLIEGFRQSLSGANLLACFFGVVVGTVVGVLPGLGVITTMALVLPLSFSLPPAAGIIMLAGIYYGAQYGGSTTSILVRTPGEASSVLTSVEGYELAKKGRAGAALAISALGSFVAGTIGVIGLSLFAPPLARLAVAFGPPEVFLVSAIALVLLCNLLGANGLQSFLIALIGVALTTVGLDSFSNAFRYTFGFSPLFGGFELVPVILGLYGLSELLAMIQNPQYAQRIAVVRMRDLFPTREELQRSIWPILRAGPIGFAVGLLPGPATVIAPLVSYFVERKVTKHPEEFGKGSIEGLASVEAANNSACSGSLVPLLGLGIPMTPSAVILMTGFMVHGIAPGPLMMSKTPHLFWTVVASMYIGNIILLFLNLPLVGLFAQAMMIPQSILVPLVSVLCFIGAYSINYSLFDVAVAVIFGVVGYLMRKKRLDPMPLVVGLALGQIIESSFRQTIILSGGSVGWFFRTPLRATLATLAIGLLAYSVFREWQGSRRARGAAAPEA
jgi:putative tricarboxylic transport membrane protein